jgi:hypothetical protein
LGFGGFDVLAELLGADEDEDGACVVEPLVTPVDVGVPGVLLLQPVKNSATALSTASGRADRRTGVRRSTPPRYGSG